MDLAPPLLSLSPAGRATGVPLRERGGGPQQTTDADVARQFETMIAATLLRSARAASLGSDSLGDGSDPGAASVRDLIDQHRADAIARAAPLGVARLLAAERRSR